MKCRTHQEEAIAICVHCGVALCASCETKSPSGRYICSDSCSEAATKAEMAAGLTLEKASKGHSVSAFFCILMGGLFIAFASIAAFNFWPLGTFLGVMGIGFIIGGFAYKRAGNKVTNQPTTA